MLAKRLLKFMADRNLKAKDMVSILGMNKSQISDLLHQKRAGSFDELEKIVDNLGRAFNLSQEQMYYLATGKDLHAEQLEQEQKKYMSDIDQKMNSLRNMMMIKKSENYKRILTK
jgi:transcriptional regulator with XRE-family HTH domain